jgi:hypothetical protein
MWRDLLFSLITVENYEQHTLFYYAKSGVTFVMWSNKCFKWTSSARNSLYIWSWKHHYWGAIRIIYREFRANNVSNKALIRLNHRSIILNWWYSPYYIIIYRIIGCFGVIWMNLILVVWIKQEKYCDIERAAGAPAQISRTKVRFKDFT